MFKSYLTTAWRAVIRQKVYALINIGGLALGMACCLFIFLWVKDEKSRDNFHANGQRLYAIYQTVTADGKKEGSYTTPYTVPNQGPANFLLEDVAEAVPEIQQTAFYATGYELPWGHPETFRSGEKIIKLEGSRAGKDFFSLFSYPLLQGNAQTALANTRGIAISRKMAGLFFGSPQQAMGRTLRYENKLDFMVTAVFEDVPDHSSLHFDFLFNWEAHKKLLAWGSNSFGTYILLRKGADPQRAAAGINRFLQSRLGKNTGTTIEAGLQPYGDQYLYNHFVNGRPAAGRMEYVRIFSGIAVFILIIACINFMNLATARSARRAREIGIRKVMGSSRAHLIGQFLGESCLFALLAGAVSLLLLYLLLPAFNHFTGKHITAPVTQASSWLGILCGVLLTGLAAGSYPALYLSSLQPVRVLKGIFRLNRSGIGFRKGLTVFQFVLSIVLIIATIVIVRQVNYVQHTHLGYDRENLLYIRIEGELANRDKYLLFKQRASALPGIAMVDRSSEAPHAMGFVVIDPVNWEGKQANDQTGFKPGSVGFDFIRLMKLDILEGRGFSRDIATDSADAFMVNEEAVKQMGMKNPVGKWISAWDKKGHIIGVLRDFHTGSLHEPIKPVIMDVKENEYFGVIIVRTKPGETPKALAGLERVYKSINPAYPFSCQFVDQEYRQLYNSELTMSGLSALFSTLAILISCLGLLGLVMFSIEQRVREIGIRKVLGASMPQIVTLISKDFLQLVCIAFLLACPLAWYPMHRWLDDFAYRVDITWWMFALAGAGALLIALFTLGLHAGRAAIANPVRSLRTE